MGLEPIRRLTHAPQTCLSAYSSTLAYINVAAVVTTLIIIRAFTPFVKHIFQIFQKIFLCDLFMPFSLQFVNRHRERIKIIFNEIIYFRKPEREECIVRLAERSLKIRVTGIYLLKALYISIKLVSRLD